MAPEPSVAGLRLTMAHACSCTQAVSPTTQGTEAPASPPLREVDPRQRFSRPVRHHAVAAKQHGAAQEQQGRAAARTLEEAGLPRRANPWSASHLLNASLSSETSYKLSRSQWENQRAQEEEELEEFEQLENDIVPSQQPTPARPLAGARRECSG